MIRIFLVAALATSLIATPVSAADVDTPPVEANARLVLTREASVTRGPLLPVLYGTLAGLQAYDGWSTVNAVRLGAREANPAVAGIATNSHAMWAVKTGATLVSIYAAERLWRRHRRMEAIVTMLAVNSVMAAVAAHNASVMRGLK
jgi:hypothetical protein